MIKLTKKDSHHQIVVTLSLEAHRVVIRIFGSVGDTPYTVHEEVLRKVDCPALNVRARCATISSVCTCVTRRERERTHTHALSLSFSSFRSVPNTRGAIYFGRRYFRIAKIRGKRRTSESAGMSRLVVVRARALAYKRVRTH